VRRGTRRWGIAIVAVLVASLLGAGGSALGQPEALQAYRVKVDAVAYSLPGSTALGVPVRKGVVARCRSTSPTRSTRCTKDRASTTPVTLPARR